VPTTTVEPEPGRISSAFFNETPPQSDPIKACGLTLDPGLFPACDLLGSGCLLLLLGCDVGFELFLRRLFVDGLRRFIAHKHFAFLDDLSPAVLSRLPEASDRNRQRPALQLPFKMGKLKYAGCVSESVNFSFQLFASLPHPLSW